MNRLLPLLLLCSLAGCSWFGGGKKEPDAPAELVEFKPTLKVKKVWSINIGRGNSKQGINLTPSFSAGSIYAGDYRGNLVAVDADTGKQQWRIKSDVPLSAGPSVSEDLILIGTLNGTVLAYSQGSRSPLWQATVSSEVLSQPVLHDDVVVVRCVDGRIFGLDARDGRRLWLYDLSVPLLSLRGNSAPLARAGVVYIGYDGGQVVALNVEDGSEIWIQPVAAAEGRTELDRLADIDGQMVLVATDLYVSSYKGRLASMATQSGRLLWFKDIGSGTGVVVERTRLSVSDHEGNLWLLDRRNGATVWKQDILLRRGLTRPAIYGNYVVVGDKEGFLHWFDADSGELLARNRTSKEGLAAAPVAIGTTLYVLANNGDLTAYRAGAAI